MPPSQDVRTAVSGIVKVSKIGAGGALIVISILLMLNKMQSDQALRDRDERIDTMQRTWLNHLDKEREFCLRAGQQ